MTTSQLIVGNTPLVRINRLSEGAGATIAAKLEFQNPAASVKDRIGVAIVDAAERSGELKPGGTIVEATSGNTGIALAMVGAARGYKVVLDDARDDEQGAARAAAGLRRRADPHRPAPGHEGRGRRAEEIGAKAGDVLARQFANEANPEIHRQTTAEEIWKDTDGEVDIVVAGIGTGGTITGVGQVLKARKPGVQIIAVEPAESPILNGGEPGPHKIQGLGANFVPEILDRDDLRRGHRHQRRDLGRVGPPGRQGGGPARRHLLRRRARRGRPGRPPARERRQDDRRHHPVVRRALPVHHPLLRPARLTLLRGAFPTP